MTYVFILYILHATSLCPFLGLDLRDDSGWDGWEFSFSLSRWPLMCPSLSQISKWASALESGTCPRLPPGLELQSHRFSSRLVLSSPRGWLLHASSKGFMLVILCPLTSFFACSSLLLNGSNAERFIRPLLISLGLQLTRSSPLELALSSSRGGGVACKRSR